MFSKSFTFFLYHHWEIQPDSADAGRMLWSGPDVLPCRPSDSEASAICFKENARMSNAPLGMLLFFPSLLKNWRGRKTKRAVNRQWKATAIMQISSALEGGTIYQFDFELQVVVCFGQSSNRIIIILHLGLQSLLIHLSKICISERNSRVTISIVYNTMTWMWDLKTHFSPNIINLRPQKPMPKLIKVHVRTNLCATTSFFCANGKIRASM